MKRIRNLIILMACLLSLCIGAVFTANISNQISAYASENSGGFNEEYDNLYADIVDRHEQGLLTMDEAEEELMELSRSAIIAGADDNGQGIVPMSLNVSGSVRWVRTSGAASLPLRGVKVELYHRDSMGPNNYIDTTYTDNNGNYSFSLGFPWISSYHTFIRVFTEGKTFRVARSWYSSITPLLQYCVETPNGFDVGANERHNLTIPFQSNELFRAFSVSQGMAWAQRYAVDVGGMSQNQTVRVAYPAAGSFCFDMAGIFGLSGSYVCGIEAGDWNDWNTVMHEYGHFVQGLKGILGQSLWDYIIYGMDHTGWEDQIQETGNKTHGLQLSWSEAWAYTFAMMAHNRYSAVYGAEASVTSEVNNYNAFGSEIVTNVHYANRGEAQENAMIALMWDLFGARNTNIPADTLTPRGHNEFWNVSAQSGTYTMSIFANRLNTVYPQFRNQIGTRLSYFKIAPQVIGTGLGLTNTPSISTPPSFSWQVNGSQSNPNNQFRIGFYNASGVQMYETGNLSFTTTADPNNPTRNDLRIASATVTQAQWDAALKYFTLGSTMNIAVKGYLNTSPTSGPYWSSYQTITAPGRFTIATASGGVSITGVVGTLNGSIDIPAAFDGQYVVAIGSSAFANQTQLSQISIPSSVTSIGDSAFINCTNLQNVSLVSEGNLTDVPDHVTSYKDYYYTERSLNVNLVAGSTYTLSFDFQLFNLSTSHTDIYTSLGVGNTTFAVDLPVQKAFANTYGRQVVTFTPTAGQLATSSKLWCRFIRTSTPQSVAIEISNVRLDKGVADVAVNSFSGCTKLATPGLSYRLNNYNNTYAVSKGTANTTTLFIPSTYNGRPVTQIDELGFKSTNFRWVFLQAGITTIGNRAFQFCPNLETVEMSATSVTSIEAYTFDVCLPNTIKNGFKDIKLPDGLLTVGEGAFIRTHNNMELPSTVTNIGPYAFAQSKRVAFGLPDSLFEIGAYAFANSAAMIALVYTGSSLAIIGDHAFEGTLLPTVGRLYASVVTVGAYAFYNSMFFTTYHIEEGSQLTKIGDYAFGNDNIERIILHSSITHIGIGAFYGNEELTIYAEQASRPSTWNVNWNNSNRPVVWGCTLSSDKTYVNSFVKSASNPSNAANGVRSPTRSGYSFGGWYTTSDFSGTQYMDLTTAPNGRLYAKWTQSSSCVAEGTLITLADGSQAAVEDLTGEEMLLVWNMLTGTFDAAPILFIDSDPYGKFEVIHLYFSDGTEVEVISEHGFWDIDLNQYVFLRSDAAQYIGHWFNKQTSDGNGNMAWTAVQLVDVVIYNQYTTAWSPVTFGHLCYYVNGMLSMPGATEGLINIFEVDAATMQYDADSFAADIATYGLFTYEEFAQIIPIPEAVFEAFNGQYLKVSIGKGLIDMYGIAALIERYAGFFQ